MDCVRQCVAAVTRDGEESEFGSLAYSPLSLQQIRSRQVWSPQTLEYRVGSEMKGQILLRYNHVCQRGLYPDDPNKENQDAFKIVPDFDDDKGVIMLGVFDGHGEYGDDCSAFVRDNISEKLRAARFEHNNDLEKAFRTAFRNINQDMHYATVRRRCPARGRRLTDRCREATAARRLTRAWATWLRTFPIRCPEPLPSLPSLTRLRCGLLMLATRARLSASSRTGS